MKLSDSLAIVSILVTVIGLGLVIWQIRMAVEQFQRAELNQRGEYLAALHERSFGSPDIRDIVQKIEYSQLKYDNGKFHASEDQQNLVQLLTFFELLAELNRLDLLRIEEIDGMFGYYIKRTRENGEVEKYLRYLREEWNKPGLKFYGFEELAKSVTRLE